MDRKIQFQKKKARRFQKNNTLEPKPAEVHRPEATQELGCSVATAATEWAFELGDELPFVGTMCLSILMGALAGLSFGWLVGFIVGIIVFVLCAFSAGASSRRNPSK